VFIDISLFFSNADELAYKNVSPFHSKESSFTHHDWNKIIKRHHSNFTIWDPKYEKNNTIKLSNQQVSRGA